MEYKIPCAECDAVYVGKTMRSLQVRMQEHRQITGSTQPQRCTITEHAHNIGHTVEWQAVMAANMEPNWRRRKIKEALPIRKNARKGPVMNKENGWTISEIWQVV